MNDYLRHIGVSLSFVTLRRLQGSFEVMLLDARAERSAAESMRSIVAATEIVHQLEEAVARCREVIAIKRSMIYGYWQHKPKGKRKGGASAPAPAPGSHAYRLLARCSTVDGPRMARSSCAGSAAVSGGRSRNAAKAPAGGQAIPAEPASFCPAAETIAGNSLNDRGIHYANLRWTQVLDLISDDYRG
jgi:hypothetical protein